MKGSAAIPSSRVRTSGERIIPDIMTPLALFRCAANGVCLELQTKVRKDFTITEKALCFCLVIINIQICQSVMIFVADPNFTSTYHF